MQFYNTMTRKKEEFEPLVPGEASVYCCGPTVYNYAHIGNLRTYIFEDVLRRALRFNGFKVKHVMNITDVGHLESDADEGEDKMEKASVKEGLSVWDLARKYEGFWLEDMTKLNIERPEVICRATEHIPDMIALIERILDHGCGYIAPGAVYFDTSKVANYTDLAQLNLSGMQAGAGGRVQQLGEKKHPFDFALWFLNKPRHIMQWESPWGPGYPGWHIECSAMSMRYLGETFDIHCGGVDHIPVHHTNEIAQSECATGKQFVRYWLHGEFLLTEQEKMSKSAENFLTLQVVADKGISPLAYRYLCLQAHYRSELKFSWENLEAARNGLRKVYGVGPETDPLTDDSRYEAARTEALAALNDDLNMPQLVGILNRWDSYRLWIEFDEVLGLGIADHARRAEAALPDDIQALVEERNAARAAKQWARSDEIRNTLQEMDYEVGDGPQGTTVKKRIV
jgi:cysteinyl-tRNA synthetase